MLLSLIIPIYNAEAFLPRLFENLEAQGVFFDNEEFGEAIFVIDGSIDNSENIIRQYGEKHPWVKVIKQDNQGQHIARNTGIKAAQGDYIAFMDQDDAYMPYALKKLLEIAITENADITRGRFENIAECDFNSWKNFDYKTEINISEKSSGIQYILKRGGLQYDDLVWATVYSGAFIRNNKFFFNSNIKYNEDGAYVWLIFPKARKVVVIEDIVYFWIQRSQSESHNTSIEHRLKRESNACHSAVFMRELYFKYKGKNDFPKEILNMMLKGSHWSCYKYLGTLVKFRGLTKKQIKPTIRRIKEEGIYPYPHSFPKDLPDGYPTSLPYRIMWRMMSFEWLLKLMLWIRSRKNPII